MTKFLEVWDRFNEVFVLNNISEISTIQEINTCSDIYLKNDKIIKTASSLDDIKREIL